MIVPRVEIPRDFNTCIDRANEWADYFIPSPRIDLEHISAYKITNNASLFNIITLIKFKLLNIQHYRFININGDALDRCRNNKLYTFDKAPFDRGVFVPEMNNIIHMGRFHAVPKKYSPFLGKTIFDNVIFYKGPGYTIDNNDVYIGDDDYPIHTLYEAEAKKILPTISGELWELRTYQNMGLSRIDKTSNTLEDRFINDYIGWRSGYADIIGSSFFARLQNLS